MNEKDKEEYTKWRGEKWEEGYHENPRQDAWELACIYKQKEIDQLHKDVKFLLDLHGYDPISNDQEIIMELKLKYL